MYAGTGDGQVKEKADRVVAGLAECQEKFGTGFLHTHPDRFTSRCEAPLPFWYQIHKILAGLLDMHLYCGNQQALDVARKLGNWACKGPASSPIPRSRPCSARSTAGSTRRWRTFPPAPVIRDTSNSASASTTWRSLVRR